MAKATNGVKMSMPEFLEEHQELVDTLKSPTKAKLFREKKKQMEEVKEVKKGHAKKVKR